MTQGPQISGDHAFRSESLDSSAHEMTYAGALSFLRRKYTRNLTGVDVAVSGIPYDGATTHRPGARFGPSAIRAASVQLAELKAFPWGFNPCEHIKTVDYGDCFLDPHHPETIIDDIQNHAKEIINTDTKMLTFGGDHFIAYPLIKAHAEKFGPVALLHFDAHSDTWEDDGTRLDHGTMFARAAAEGIVDTTHSVQVGLRTHNDDNPGFKILSAPWVHISGVEKTIEAIRERVQDKPVYLTFDIDCLDPAFAPGTGTPVVGGLSTAQVLGILRGLGGLNWLGMDLVEVAPAYDQAEITALAAATIAHDWLCLLAQEKLNG